MNIYGYTTMKPHKNTFNHAWTCNFTGTSYIIQLEILVQNAGKITGYFN